MRGWSLGWSVQGFEPTLPSSGGGNRLMEGIPLDGATGQRSPQISEERTGSEAWVTGAL